MPVLPISQIKKLRTDFCTKLFYPFGAECGSLLLAVTAAYLHRHLVGIAEDRLERAPQEEGLPARSAAGTVPPEDKLPSARSAAGVSLLVESSRDWDGSFLIIESLSLGDTVF